MARPREFDTDKAIGDALNVFWTHGYQGTTLPDLLAGMNLTRGSLYKAFKDKKNLFLIVLQQYETTAVDAAVALLSDPAVPNGWDRICQLFELVAQDAANNDRRGCLLCSAAAGPGAYDPDIAKVVNGGLSKIRNALELALRDSDVHRTMTTAQRSELAGVLTTQYVGLRILARSLVPLAELQRTAGFLRQMPWCDSPAPSTDA